MDHGQLDLQNMATTLGQLDTQQIEWQHVQTVQILLHQQFRYEYPGPINDLKQTFMILPPEQHGNQYKIAHHIRISTSLSELIDHTDSFGNRKIHLHIPQIEQAFDFEAIVLVERKADEKTYRVLAHNLTRKDYLEPSTLTRGNQELEEIAQELQINTTDHYTLAQHINTWTHQHLQYKHDVTNIHTSAQEALALGKGVCQDYAHVMLALCHLCHLPARYVSGHLLGEGGTHAWVEVFFPATDQQGMARVIAFDPTHGKLAGLNYLTVAVGRDYYDVAPTSGTFSAPYSGQLITQKRAGLITIEYRKKETIDHIPTITDKYLND